jgi:hypothetical protein
LGVWGWGFWVGGLGFGPNPPIPNPQSPIPNPHPHINTLIIFKIFKKYKKLFLFTLKRFNLFIK